MVLSKTAAVNDVTSVIGAGIGVAPDTVDAIMSPLKNSEPPHSWETQPTVHSKGTSVVGARDATSEQPAKDLSTLYPGITFTGYQMSGDKKYNVEVHIKDVDLTQAYICGDLKIKGLTPQYPELITFFDAEIIGKKHSFVTGKWKSSIDVDKQHWRKFDAFQALERLHGGEGREACFKPDFKYDVTSADHVFMRWKEHFLVPNHKVDSIKGASFAGFYYICFSRRTGRVEGLYYHSMSEMYQRLALSMVEERQFKMYSFR